MIEIKDLEKTYVIHKLFEGFNIRKIKKIPALHSVSMNIPYGKVTGLAGPNGAGKTTLLKILIGVLIPDAGEVTFDGIKLCDNEEYFHLNTGFVNNEERSFYWRLSVMDNLEFFMGIFKGCQNREHVMDILRMLKMDEKADMPFRMLSSGMKAKVQIARALLREPKFLVLDEPFSNIDMRSREEIQRFLTIWLKEGDRAILITSHHLKEISDWIDRTVLIDEGTVAGIFEKSLKKKKKVHVIFEDGTKNTMSMAEFKKLKTTEGLKDIHIEDEMLTELIERLTGEKK